MIIESPLQQRASLQILNANNHYLPTKSTDIHRSNLSFHSDKLRPNSFRLFQKKTSLSHSISNYAVSAQKFPTQLTTRYPSTPLLASSRQKNIDRFVSHPSQIHPSPLATFDDDDDDSDSDSLTSYRSFRSCIDSINDYSDINTTEISSLTESYYPETFSDFDINIEGTHETMKHLRSSARHLCILQ